MVNKAKICSVIANLLPLGTLLVGFALATALLGLGDMFNMPPEFKYPVSIGVSILVFAHGAWAIHSKSQSGRVLNGLSVGVWLAMALFLGGMFIVFRMADVTGTKDMVNKLETFLPNTQIPPDIPAIGQLAYASVLLIGLATGVLSLVVPRVAENGIDGETAGSIVGRYGFTVAVLVVVAASFISTLQFGLRFGSESAFSALAVALVAETCLLVGKTKATAEIKSRSQSGTYDAFDLWMWVGLSLLSLVFMGCVAIMSQRADNAMLAGGEQAAARALETVLQEPFFRFINDLYGVGYVVFGGALVLISFVTATVDARRTASEDVLEGQIVGEHKTKPALGHRVAAGIRGQREGWSDAWNALTGDRPPVVSTPQIAAKTSEGIADPK